MSLQYREAAKLLTAVQEKKGSLKTLAFALAGKDEAAAQRSRKNYALVSETLRYMPVLESLIAADGLQGSLFSEGAVRDSSQGFIMLYDLLIGKGSIQGGGALKRHITEHLQQLQAALTQLKSSKGLPADAPLELLLPANARRLIFPRYARVNLMKSSVEAAVTQLQSEGLTVATDDIVPELLVLPPATDLHAHELVISGKLILQDKSSCFPAQALLSDTAWLNGGDVIDCCAAPGNKTTHLASLLSKVKQPRQPHVYAFDRDKQRLALLKRRCNEAGGALRITACLQDFLDVDVCDTRFEHVRGILLDPSCSGSGIVTACERLHEVSENDIDNDTTDSSGQTRVKNLAQFQLQALLKALSFPQAKRLVYSTCSVHEQENEHVVAAALQEQQRRAPADTWRLRKCLPNWHRRGIYSNTDGSSGSSSDSNARLTAAQADCVVRALPADKTNGFFVALFVRGDVPADIHSTTTNTTTKSVLGKRSSSDAAVTKELTEAQRAKKRLKNSRKKKNQRARQKAETAAAVGTNTNGSNINDANYDNDDADSSSENGE
jgi:25S rRNA (cytosine2278-C5)-methyltransferase